MRLQLVGVAITLGTLACGSTDPTVIASSVASPNPAHLTETVTVTVSITNVSGKTISVSSPNDGCTKHFAIIDGNGRAATAPPIGCIAVVVPPVELRPGESLSYAESLTPSSWTINGQPLTAGDYEVRPANIGNVTFGSSASVMLQLVP